MYYEAIQLFVERAKVAQPAFRLTLQNMELVAQICCRLEGHPLAIELAAARVAILSLEQIRSRLSDCRSLLSGGYRLSLLRNQAMWATLDYSYSLLTEKERWLFQRIAVFPNSFSLEAIETIGAYGDIHAW
jgi:predicted ATPase